MKETMNKIEVKLERTIPASVDEVYDGWLDPKIPGNPWNAADRFLLNPEVDGFFYWTIKGTAHYGRFTEVERPRRIQHTWVSPNTLGHESTVTVSFEERAEGTLMTLVHSDLPDDDRARSHEKGWGRFLGIFLEQFGTLRGSRGDERFVGRNFQPVNFISDTKGDNKW